MLKIKIDTKSMFEKGLKSINEDFQVVLICGYMGSGKNYFSFYQADKIGRKVLTNVHSYHCVNNNLYDVSYFTFIEELYDNYEKNLLVIIDECGKKFPKDCKIDKNFYSWLQHSRKTNRYVYLIFQEYLNVPQWIRGVANRVYTTRKVPLLPFQITSFGIPILDLETKEWGLQELKILLYKRTKRIGDSYDTYEIIQQL